MEVRLGGVVGLRHREKKLTNMWTHLEVHSDGEQRPFSILHSSISLHHIGTTLALAKADPTMDSFGVIIIDEAHEHSRDADILLGHLKVLLNERENLKVVVMSASLDTALFINYLPHAAVEEVRGRQHKVHVNYLEQPSSDLIADIIGTILYVHCTQMPGDILVFVTGKDEIDKVINGVERLARKDMGLLTLCSLHDSHSMKDQNIAIDPHQPQTRHGNLGRKVIVSTNSAETSLTIEGVTHVIDSCRAKVNAWDPYTESFALINQPISKASVLHRKGRAGRTYEGMAWLMCTERGFHEDLVEHSVPQVLQGDMLSECLTIIKLGHDPITFDFIIPPAPETIVRALGLLRQLGAIDVEGRLSLRGQGLAAIPTDVYAAMTLLESPRFGCSDEILSILAMADATDGGSHLFQRAYSRKEHKKRREIKDKFQHPSGDHITLFNIYMAWREACHQRKKKKQDKFLRENMLLKSALEKADGLRLHYLEAMNKITGWNHCRLQNNNLHYYTKILEALAAGHYLHAAKRIPSSKRYELVRSGMNVVLSEHTNLGDQNKHNEWVIYNDCFNNGTNKKLRVVSSVTPELLVAAQPQYWWDIEFLPQGHISDGLLQTLSDIIGHDGILPGGMPVGVKPGVGGPTWAGMATWVVKHMITGNEPLKTTLYSWKKERDVRSEKAELLKKWNLRRAIAAGFDDGSSRYDHPGKHHPSSFSIRQINAKKVKEGRKRAPSITSSE
jgi:pre-mRNA-splicing factor ATP-dependent RNA helicase DHX15/PRP43